MQNSLKLFISHASEDKDAIARPLATALSEQGHRVWFDEFVLNVGDSLRASIDSGLGDCDFGIVILSPDFFRKQWTQQELNGLIAREMGEVEKFVLPIWHNLEAQDVRAHSPLLADRYALSSQSTMESLVAAILKAADAKTRSRRQATLKFQSPFGGSLFMEARPNSLPQIGEQQTTQFFTEERLRELFDQVTNQLRDTNLSRKE